MNKKLLIALCLILASAAVKAQSKNVKKISIGLDIGGVSGPQADRYTNTFGGLVSYQLPLASTLALTATTGYTWFLGNNSDYYTAETPNFNYTAIPVKAGLKYYLNEWVSIEGQLGATFGTNSEAQTGFIYSPGIGFDLAAGIGVGLRYENWIFKRRNPALNENLGQVAVRLSYGF